MFYWNYFTFISLLLLLTFFIVVVVVILTESVHQDKRVMNHFFLYNM